VRIDRFIGVAAVALAAAGTVQAAPAARDARVWSAAQAARPAQLQLLQQAVDIDSGTGDVEGGRKLAALLIPRLQALGMTVEAVPAEAAGLPENIVATLKGTGKGRILLIGHIDTVFGPGTVAQRPFRMDAEKAYGPGVSDEKGGVIEGLYALQILHDLGFKGFKQITFLIETSEERGSPGTQNLIRKLLTDADVELNLEPGDPPDVLTVWRKGSTTFHIDVKGRAAHAGVAPQDGRNAAVELIHQLQGADSLPKSGDGLTANLTLMSAGTRNNTIPENAQAQINVRVRDKADIERVSNPATDALAGRAEAIYAGLGMKVGRGGNGGASESAMAADAHVPALDGLGPVGGGFHSDAEYLDLKSVSPRLYLLTKLIMELGANPPAPMK
jgi:glutamate carboxypeptidase